MYIRRLQLLAKKYDERIESVVVMFCMFLIAFATLIVSNQYEIKYSKQLSITLPVKNPIICELEAVNKNQDNISALLSVIETDSQEDTYTSTDSEISDTEEEIKYDEKEEENVDDNTNGISEISTDIEVPSQSYTGGNIPVYGRNNINYITQEEYEMIAGIVMAEAGGEPFDGQVAVAEVILNRVDDPRFDNTVYGVLSAPNQFSTFGYTVYAPTDSVYKAVLEACNGTHWDTRMFYFTSIYYIGEPYMQLHHHYFGLG